MASKAYGMENGNWIGIESSILEKTLQDTTNGNIMHEELNI
jgi:hypothetical protein